MLNMKMQSTCLSSPPPIVWLDSVGFNVGVGVAIVREGAGEDGAKFRH